jgi:HK97 family phage portal protein
MTAEAEIAVLNNPMESRDITLRAGTSEWEEFLGRASQTRSPLAVPAVWSCVTAIADSVAALPLKLYEKTKDGVGVERSAHPAARVIERPNEIQNAHTFRRAMAMSLAARGNAYAIIERGELGPKSLTFVPPDHVGVYELEDGSLRYDLRLPGGRARTLFGPQMIHVVGDTLDGKIGVSPLQAHRHLYEHDASMSEYGSAFYKRGARISGFLETEARLDKQQVDELRERFTKAYAAGGEDEGKVAVLTSGLKFHNANLISPTDADYIQARKLSATEICMIWRVPPPLIGLLENATLNNVENLHRWFLQSTVGHYLDAIEAELTRKLVRDRDRSLLYFEHSTERHLRGSSKEQAEASRVRIMAGYLTPNEARQRENLPPLPNLDEPLRPGNMAPAAEEPEPNLQAEAVPGAGAAPSGDPILDAGDNEAQDRKRPVWDVERNGYA